MDENGLNWPSKGSGKRLKVREKSVKSQGILKWILSGNPVDSILPSFPDQFKKIIKLYRRANMGIMRQSTCFVTKPITITN